MSCNHVDLEFHNDHTNIRMNIQYMKINTSLQCLLNLLYKNEVANKLFLSLRDIVHMLGIFNQNRQTNQISVNI